METLVELERIQTRLLERISNLEVSLLSKNISSLSVSSSPGGGSPDEVNGASKTVERLSSILRSNGVRDFVFKTVPSNYYDWTFEERRDILGAHSINHLCKSIVMVNTQAPPSVTDCSDRNYSKYYVVVVQYTARLNAEAIRNFLYSLNDGKIAKKKINNNGGAVFSVLVGNDNAIRFLPSVHHHFCVVHLEYIEKEMRLAPEETSQKLTGFEHNAVTCVGMLTDIPVILDEAIVKLDPDFFWLGGGEVDLKLGIRTSEFINFAKPFIVSCSN